MEHFSKVPEPLFHVCGFVLRRVDQLLHIFVRCPMSRDEELSSSSTSIVPELSRSIESHTRLALEISAGVSSLYCGKLLSATVALVLRRTLHRRAAQGAHEEIVRVGGRQHVGLFRRAIDRAEARADGRLVLLVLGDLLGPPLHRMRRHPR